MKTAVICNISERWIYKADKFVEQVSKTFMRSSEIFIVDKTQHNSTEKHLQKIIYGKFDRIVVAAGDGTLNRVVNFLGKTNNLNEFQLAIVPLGTCNDFARNLGLRAGKIELALESAAENIVKRITVSKVNGHYFINNAGFGKKNPTEKKKNPFSIIREMRPVKLKAFWQRQRMEGEFFMMLCANAPYFSGGLHFSKKSQPFDDMLEFFFVKKTFKLGLALKLLAGRIRFPLHTPRLSRTILKVQTPKLTIQTETPVSIVADGEPIAKLSDTTEATFEIAERCNFIVGSGG